MSCHGLRPDEKRIGLAARLNRDLDASATSPARTATTRTFPAGRAPREAYADGGGPARSSEASTSGPAVPSIATSPSIGSWSFATTRTPSGRSRMGSAGDTRNVMPGRIGQAAPTLENTAATSTVGAEEGAPTTPAHRARRAARRGRGSRHARRARADLRRSKTRRTEHPSRDNRASRPGRRRRGGASLDRTWQNREVPAKRPAAYPLERARFLFHSRSAALWCAPFQPAPRRLVRPVHGPGPAHVGGEELPSDSSASSAKSRRNTLPAPAGAWGPKRESS